MAGGGSKSASRSSGSSRGNGRVTRNELNNAGVQGNTPNQQQINTIAQGRNAIARTGQNFRRSGNENALLDSLNRSTRRTNDVINRSNQNALRAGSNNISRTGNIRDRNNQRKMNRPITRPGQQETILDRLNRPPGAPAPQAQNQIRRLRRGQA